PLSTLYIYLDHFGTWQVVFEDKLVQSVERHFNPLLHFRDVSAVQYGAAETIVRDEDLRRTPVIGECDCVKVEVGATFQSLSKAFPIKRHYFRQRFEEVILRRRKGQRDGIRPHAVRGADVENNRWFETLLLEPLQRSCFVGEQIHRAAFIIQASTDK